MERKTKFFIISMSICLSLMLLCSTILILPTTTWLSKENSFTGNSSDNTIARAGVTVLDGDNEIVTNKTNIIDLNDISSYSLSQNYIYDVDTNSNSCTINSYGMFLYDNNWVMENLEPSTTYTLSFVMEMLNAVSNPSSNFKGLYLYSVVLSSGIHICANNDTMTNGQTKKLSDTFTTPANLHDTNTEYYLYVYSEINNTSGSFSKVRFHNLTLVEGTQTSQQYHSNVVLGAVNTATTVNHKVKNTGTAQELVRVYYAIKDLDNEKVLTSDDVSVSINSDFIAHEKLDGVWAGYLYYNKALDANALVSIINSITPSASYANKGVIIQIQAECVLYSGNAYSTGQTTKYPWSSVPSTWFVMS